MNQTTGEKPSDLRDPGEQARIRVHQQVLPDERADRRHDEERRDHHEPQHVLPEHRLVHQQRDQNAADDADDQHRDDEDERVDERGDEIRIGQEGRVVLQPDEAGRCRGRAGCSAGSRSRASSPAGRSSRAKSRMTEGATSMRPAAVVCWVAIAEGPPAVLLRPCSRRPRDGESRRDDPAATGPSSADCQRRSRSRAPVVHPPESPSPRAGRGGDGEDVPEDAPAALGREANGLGLLDVAGLLHRRLRCSPAPWRARRRRSSLPASAAEKSWPTSVPMPWNSGIATNCTPV